VAFLDEGIQNLTRLGDGTSHAEPDDVERKAVSFVGNGFHAALIIRLAAAGGEWWRLPDSTRHQSNKTRATAVRPILRQEK